MTSSFLTRPTAPHPRSRVGVGAVGVAALLGILLGTVSPAHAAETPILIPDSALRACLNAALGQPENADILPAQAADSDAQISAHCHDAGIARLDGIEYFTGLHFLDISGNSIRDAAPLGALGRNLTRAGLTLSDIHIERNHITDFSALGDLVVRYYFFAEPQQETLPAIHPLTPVNNPLRNQDGSIIVPTSTDPGFSYDAASNTFTFATFGPKTLTWTAPLTPGSQTYNYTTSGTLNISVTDTRGGETPTASPTATTTPTATPTSSAPTSSTPTGPVSAEPSAPGTSATPGSPTSPGSATSSALPVAPGASNPSLAQTGLGLSVPAFGAVIALLLGAGALLARRRSHAPEADRT
ncbi:LPXTG-motif cell wall-anchored protein [Mycetocola sp. BIGb0189]|uniref:LPXTG cell wall anchor domain-containing protein n=1 Tax=Mycetocola sp. BIGb0189 TaxID=2940604 RepID=UPI0021693AF9|nr:LPXTG cell wall anchor domain-containing protein [Mycetocola sp. BIGb0189]MCS4276500.1 LPXTG-motif cell wall-anchored protein [Mycetocola sp. BIGb0189]